MLNEKILNELCKTWRKYYKDENQKIITISNKGIRLDKEDFLDTFNEYIITRNEKITECERLKRYETWHYGVKIFTHFIEPW